MSLRLSIRQVALAIALAAAATVGGALVFEHAFGYVPCKLCLIQRQPYYAAIPIGLAASLRPPRWGRLGLWLLALVFLVSAAGGWQRRNRRRTSREPRRQSGPPAGRRQTGCGS